MAAPSSFSRRAQVRYYWRTLTTPRSSLLSTKVACPLSWANFYFLVSQRTTSPYSTSCSFLFFFRLGIGSRPVTGGGKGGRKERGWDFGVFLKDDPLFLPARRSFKPFLGLSDISFSSSSELSSIFASTRPRVRTPEILSNSSSGSDMWMARSPYSSISSSRWNWSISSSSDRHEEAVSSLEAAASGRARTGGSSAGTTSFRARNPSTDMSILRSLGSPAMIAWPTSWKLSKIGSKSKIRWIALSYLSSLTNTSDLRTLLRSVTLTKLR